MIFLKETILLFKSTTTKNGLLYDVTREDGLAFDAKSLDVKYHNSMSSRRLNSQ